MTVQQINTTSSLNGLKECRMGFSCDLVGNASKHLQFLKDIHTYSCNVTSISGGACRSNDVDELHTTKSTNDKVIITESYRRYNELWLLLVTDVNSAATNSIHQPDIAWLWHCHRLAPKLYVEYVFKHSGIPPRRLRPLLCRKLQRYIKKGLKVRWVYGQKCILKKAFS